MTGDELPIAYLRDAHEGEGEPCYVPAAKGDAGAFPVYTLAKAGDGHAAALREVSALREALSDMLLRLDNKIALARDSNATLYGHSYVLCAGIEACIEASNARALATGEKP